MSARSMKEDDPLEDFVRRETPGISPHVARFARWVRDAGFTAYMPSLFGRDGGAANQSSPVTQWLRALARLAHQECGGVGVGAIGMCFTGNFALTMMLEPSLLAPVLSQPALLLNDPGGLEIAPEDIKAVRDRLEREDLAYRGSTRNVSQTTVSPRGPRLATSSAT